MREGSTRRRFLELSLSVAVVGTTAGCNGDQETDPEATATTDGQQFPSGTIVLETPDGTRQAVEPVESDQSVSSYYNYDGPNSDSSATPDGLEMEDATVSFLYRNSSTGALSLVTLNGDATGSTDGGGMVPMAFTGVSGYQWEVQDGSPGGDSFGDTDPYTTASGEFGETERVIWGWNDNRTDGGAFGPLGSSFDIDITSLERATVNDITDAREGLDEWVFVDGGAMDSPIELANFESSETSTTMSGTPTTPVGDGMGDLTARIYVVGELDTDGDTTPTAGEDGSPSDG